MHILIGLMLAGFFLIVVFGVRFVRYLIIGTVVALVTLFVCLGAVEYVQEARHRAAMQAPASGTPALPADPRTLTAHRQG